MMVGRVDVGIRDDLGVSDTVEAGTRCRRRHRRREPRAVAKVGRSLVRGRPALGPGEVVVGHVGREGVERRRVRIVALRRAGRRLGRRAWVGWVVDRGRPRVGPGLVRKRSLEDWVGVRVLRDAGRMMSEMFHSLRQSCLRNGRTSVGVISGWGETWP